MNPTRQKMTCPCYGAAARAGSGARALVAGWAMAWLPPAAAQAPPPGGGGGEFFIFMLILFGMMYFMMIRPQMKKAKQHRQMLESLRKGDEVVTNGGLLGRILDIGDNFLLLELEKGVQVRLQKVAVQMVLPKGSLQKL